MPRVRRARSFGGRPRRTRIFGDLSGLPGGAEAIRLRTGQNAELYRSADDQCYQIPWVTRPVMLMYNQQIFRAAGLDPDEPRLSSYADFTRAARAITSTRAARYAIQPTYRSDSEAVTGTFLPFYAAASQGVGLLVDGRATFDDPAGVAAATFWQSLYTEAQAGPPDVTGDPFAAGRAAMALVGPAAVADYRQPVDEGVVPVPTRSGRSPLNSFTAAGATSIVMPVSCPDHDAAWAFATFATADEQDRLLARTGLIPARNNQSSSYRNLYPGQPIFQAFASQAETVVDVPVSPRVDEMLSATGHAWVTSVVEGHVDPKAALATAARDVTTLAQR